MRVMKELGLGIILVFLLGIGSFLYHNAVREINQTPEPSRPGVACTLDAKLCPDGSYVGRVPPECNFASCPQKATTTATTTSE